MRKQLTTALIACCLCLNVSNEAMAQKGEGAVAAASILGAAAFAVIQYDRMLELLELQATQQILQTRPEQDAFKVKVMRLEDSKASDISSETILLYEVTFYDKLNLKPKSKEVLMMITAPNWINEFGIEYDQLNWIWFNEQKWNRLFATFVDIATPATINGTQIQAFREISKTAFSGADDEIMLNRMGESGFKNDEYFQATGQFIDVSKLRLTGIGLRIDASEVVGNERLRIPLYDIGRDQYLSGKFDDDLDILVNENTFGLHIRELNRVVQIPRQFIRDVHVFVNESMSIGTLELSEVRAIQNNDSESIKSIFSVGDKGYYNITKDDWCEFEVISVEQRGSDSAEHILRIKYVDEGELKEKNILSSSDRLSWPSSYDN